MEKSRDLILTAFLAFLWLAMASPLHAMPLDVAQPPAPVRDLSPARVVLIRNWDSLYPVNVVREQAMRIALVEGSQRVIEIYPEEIDPLRFPGGQDREFVALLQQKYRHTPVELVIASGLEPLEFASKHRDRIWPGATIMFNGVIDGMLGNWKRPPHSTGVTMILDVDGALELAVNLVPSARKIYFVSGSALFDRAYLDLALQALRRFRRPLEPQFIVGLSIQETLDRVATIEPDSIVLFLSLLRDGKGQFAGPGAPTVDQVSAASRAPVFVASHTQFLKGPVGGSSSRFDLHGQAAGLLARSLLEGADPDRIEVRPSPGPWCQVDWNGLQKWNIPRGNVPAHCEIANVPLSIWDTYLWPVAGMIATIVLQAALLWALAIQMRRRRRAEEQLRVRSSEMAQVARVAMVGALTASIAHEINQPMGAILSNAEAARMMLDQGTLEPEKLRAILADIRDEDLRASAVIRGLRSLLARSEWKPEALELNAAVAEALRHVAFDAARRNIRLTPVFGSRVPTVTGDATQLQQVVINLVLNAMDAASMVPDRSEVRIETRTAKDGVEIAVADQGPGLSADDAARVFQSSFTTKKDGMGFGLSIVRTIVEMHGGRVSFEPNVPRGAVFRVWLPAVAA